MDQYINSKNPVWKEKLCPIIFHLPFGMLNVMPKARILKPNELSRQQLVEFCTCSDGSKIPTELAYDSFGYLDEKLVCIDYHDRGH